MPVVRVRKLGKHRGHYELILTDGRAIPLGTAHELIQPRKVQSAIIDVLGNGAIPVPKLRKWRTIGESICAAATVEDIGCEPDQELNAWITEYVLPAHRRLTDTGPNKLEITDKAELIERMRKQGSARFGGCIYLTLRGLHRWLRSQDFKLSQFDLSARLFKLGWSDDQSSQWNPELKTNDKARCLVSPPGWLEIGGRMTGSKALHFATVRTKQEHSAGSGCRLRSCKTGA